MRRQGTLDLEDPNMEGVPDIYDVGVVLTPDHENICGTAEQTRPETATS